MVLLGLYHDCSLFTSTVAIILSGACDNWHCERERKQREGEPKRIGALKSLVVYGFEPQPPEWQASDFSIAQCPAGMLVDLNK